MSQELKFQDNSLTPILVVSRGWIEENQMVLLVDHSKSNAPLMEHNVLNSSVFRWYLDDFIKKNNLLFKITGEVEGWDFFENGEPLWRFIVPGHEISDIEYFIDNLE